MRSFYLALIIVATQAHSASREHVQKTLAEFRELRSAQTAQIAQVCPTLANSTEEQEWIDQILSRATDKETELLVCTTSDLEAISSYAKCAHTLAKEKSENGCQDFTSDEFATCSAKLAISTPCFTIILSLLASDEVISDD